MTDPTAELTAAHPYRTKRARAELKREGLELSVKNLLERVICCECGPCRRAKRGLKA